MRGRRRPWRSATTRHAVPATRASVALLPSGRNNAAAAVVCRPGELSDATGQGTDGDRDRPARERGAAGRPGGDEVIACHECGTVHRLPRDGGRHGRALHRLRRDDLHPLRAVGAAHAGALPRRPLPGAGRQRLPDHDHVAGGPEQRRHHPGQRQGALRRRHVAPGDRRGPGRRGHAAGQDRRHAGDPAAPASRAAAALDGRGLSLGRAAAALGDDGGLPAGRDRRLREAPGSGDDPSRRGDLRLRRHHPPLGRGRRALRPARDLAPPRPAGGSRRPGRRSPAPCCSPASNATRWCGRMPRSCTASPARAAARRSIAASRTASIAPGRWCSPRPSSTSRPTCCR